MCLSNFPAICKTEDFLQLPKDMVVQLLSHEELETEDERLTFMCDKLYLVDQKAKEIIPKADIPSPRKEFSACAIGCKVYITGGRGSENGVSKDVWVYDTVHEEWSKAAPMLIARFGHGSAELKHCLYVVGGHTAATGCLPASPSVSLKQVEQFDPVANKWTMVAPLREGVSNAAVVSVKLKLFAFGGTSVTHDKLPKVQCYDPQENRWTVPASCPQPWRYTAAAVLGNQIFVMGGDTEFSACSAYKFSSENYQWTKVGDVTAKRMSCQAVASGNKLYVVGGYFGTQRCKTLDCYDPTLDAWNSITTVPYSLIPTAFVSTWKHLPAPRTFDVGGREVVFTPQKREEACNSCRKPFIISYMVKGKKRQQGKRGRGAGELAGTNPILHNSIAHTSSLIIYHFVCSFDDLILTQHSCSDDKQARPTRLEEGQMRREV
ncbi:hypothetical protein CCH79_00001115 [Gambusia affinis]|uniref:BACK domain-containing protein n=1 Tax=Gambusia affinis TaxID=33528 RepID=A0A315VT31_GAMAF|nr:hypothetical protein CCH79_00001115 [Gambusia affinis]